MEQNSGKDAGGKNMLIIHRPQEGGIIIKNNVWYKGNGFTNNHRAEDIEDNLKLVKIPKIHSKCV